MMKQEFKKHGDTASGYRSTTYFYHEFLMKSYSEQRIEAGAGKRGDQEKLEKEAEAINGPRWALKKEESLRPQNSHSAHPQSQCDPILGYPKFLLLP